MIKTESARSAWVLVLFLKHWTNVHDDMRIIFPLPSQLYLWHFCDCGSKDWQLYWNIRHSDESLLISSMVRTLLSSVLGSLHITGGVCFVLSYKTWSFTECTIPSWKPLAFPWCSWRLYLVRAGIIAPEVSKGRSVKRFLLVRTYKKAFAALFVTYWYILIFHLWLQRCCHAPL